MPGLKTLAIRHYLLPLAKVGAGRAMFCEVLYSLLFQQLFAHASTN